MITLKNQNLTVKISERGAEMQSIVKNGVEYLWQGLPEIWSGRAPVLFPICGGLKNDKFTYDGREYTMPKHGFVKSEIFEVEKISDTFATFLHVSGEKTLEMYPFSYEFRVIYQLLDDSIEITFAVTNKDNKTMYFSVGSHEAYATPEGIEDYDIIFPEKETLDLIMLDGSLLTDRTFPVMKNSNTLPLYDKYFLMDSPVFENMKSESATLRNRKTGRFVKVDFPGKPYFLLWHMHGAPYICLEPWSGCPDYQTKYGDITKKVGITSLDARKNYKISHKITVGEE